MPAALWLLLASGLPADLNLCTTLDLHIHKAAPLCGDLTVDMTFYIRHLDFCVCCSTFHILYLSICVCCRLLLLV